MTGCASSVSNTVSYNQPGEIRNTTETAPADLQLSCASAAANQFGLASDKVLPTASSKLLDGTYNIELMAEGQGYLCRIDENATILAITPA
jgi:hypothetical protein